MVLLNTVPNAKLAINIFSFTKVFLDTSLTFDQFMIFPESCEICGHFHIFSTHLVTLSVYWFPSANLISQLTHSQAVSLRLLIHFNVCLSTERPSEHLAGYSEY